MRYLMLCAGLLSLVNLAFAENNLFCQGETYIECEASKYDGNSWSSLGQFRSHNEPIYNNGEPSCNAEFKSGSLRFSADGNFQEGLIYFGSIYDYEGRVGAQIQLAKREEISLYLFSDGKQYSLDCKMLPN